MSEARFHIRSATLADRDRINHVIERAVSTWNLPERVRRLSLPMYRYDEADLEHLNVIVAQTPDRQIIGVAGWEAASTGDAPAGRTALLLHGLYVAPDWHGRGVGTQLLAAVESAAGAGGEDALVVKAQRDAESFFLCAGFEPLAAGDEARDYPRRLWKPLAGASR